jgi:uncharacterized membrane protein
MKFKWQTELPQLLLLTGMFLLAALTWSTAPDKIPMHWNFSGEVDSYGGRFEGLLAIPLLTLGIYVLLWVVPLIDPGRANYKRFAGPYTTIRMALVVLMAALYGVIHLWLRGHQVSVATVVPILVGCLFLVLGNLFGKIRPNWFVGIRTPWTLSSKASWVKTHRLGGWLFVVLGLLFISVGILHSRWTMWVLVVGGGISIACLFAYSWWVWKNDPDKVPPAGTLPADE